MNLPFGLKQKPLSHYFNGGVIRFNMIDGDMYYKITQITKDKIAVLTKGIVKDKDFLNKLLSIKSLHEIPTIEEVVN